MDKHLKGAKTPMPQIKPMPPKAIPQTAQKPAISVKVTAAKKPSAKAKEPQDAVQLELFDLNNL
jgi:hypothetical protein